MSAIKRGCQNSDECISGYSPELLQMSRSLIVAGLRRHYKLPSLCEGIKFRFLVMLVILWEERQVAFPRY